jgi:tRNA1Val (adenine37-N6)-methyltransferase
MDKKDKILDYNLLAHQEEGMFKFSVDTLIIARFPIFNNKVKNILEVGTNNGIVSLIVSEFTNASIEAIEINQRASEIAIKNILRNKKEKQIKIIHHDFLTYEFDKKYDYIISNPPYFSKESGRTTPNKEMERAMFDDYLPLEKFIKKSSSLLPTKGKLVFIYETKRLAEVMVLLKENKLTPKRMQMIHFTKEKESQIFIIESVRDANKGLHVIPPLYVTDKNGEYSKQMKER